MKIFTDRTYIIAEIGVNHNGDLNLAKKMIQEAKRCGADAVKFQTFTAESLVGKNVPKVQYQRERTDSSESHYEMIKSLELSHDAHRVLFEFCDSIEIDFLSTPYDVESAKFLHILGVKVFKVASADIVDYDLLEFIASTKVPAIVSTGMSTIGEVEAAYSIFKKHGSEQNLALLHCVSNYPCQISSLNLNVLKTLMQTFQCVVGYSDHATGSYPAIASVVLGGRIVEKHFTLDRNLPGPDHYASATPEEFLDLVKGIRTVELALGSAVKQVQPEEIEMKSVSRKSITFKKDLKAGHRITEVDICLKRPGTGLTAAQKNLVLNQVLSENVEASSIVRLDQLGSMGIEK